MHTAVSTSKKGTIIPATLAASAIIGFLTLTGLYLLPARIPPTSMHLDPIQLTVQPTATFTVQVRVDSLTPVNAFAGTLQFDSRALAVEKIEYNTSIADLWAETPWFSNGDGTITFAGGSTRVGGFTGSGSLITVTFTALALGEATLKLTDTRVLQHDGLGTDVPLTTPIEAVFTIGSTSDTQAVLPPELVTTIAVIPAGGQSTDLNNDTLTNLADVSIFMLYLTTGNSRADFNQDGRVSTADLSILLNQRE